MSADGRLLVVGAWFERSSATGINGEQSNNSSRSGAAYVFARDDAGWSQTAYVKASNTGTDDNFGWSVAVSGDGRTFAIGAPGEDGASTVINGDQTSNAASNSGAVYVYSDGTAGWEQQAYIKASNTGAGDDFGRAVSLSFDGDLLVVGAPGEDGSAVGVNGVVDDSAANSGAAYLFSRTSTTWSEVAYLKASNTEASDDFGRSVSVSPDGRYVGVGAPGEDSGATGLNGDETDNGEGSAGAVYLFEYDSVAGLRQLVYMKPSNSGIGDQFGASLALSSDANVVVVSSIAEDGASAGVGGNPRNNSLTDSGAAFVFTRGGDGWREHAYAKASNPDSSDYFATWVACSSDGTTFVSVSYNERSSATGIDGNQSDNSLSMSGAAYVFRLFSPAP
jgi:hypothetical protein